MENLLPFVVFPSWPYFCVYHGRKSIVHSNFSLLGYQDFQKQVGKRYKIVDEAIYDDTMTNRKVTVLMKLTRSLGSKKNDTLMKFEIDAFLSYSK